MFNNSYTTTVNVHITEHYDKIRRNIEHGTMATDDDLKLMAEKGAYLDPQAGLIIENYLLNKEKYLGTPGYTEEGFAAMEKVLSLNHKLVPELKRGRAALWPLSYL